MAKLRHPEINSFILSGNVTRDAELTFTPAGMPVCKFSIAHNRRVKNGDKWESVPMFLNCTLFGKFAESNAQQLLKGRSLIVEGNLRSRDVDREGQKRTYFEVVCNRVQFLDWGAHEEDDAPQARQAQTPQREERAPVYAEDDIPF